MIYDLVKDSEIQHRLPRAYGPRHPAQSPIRLPLRDLARSCKLLAQEIRDHRQSLPPHERHATIRILVRSDDHDHDYYLSHASCPAQDITILKLEYTVSLAAYYWTDHFPEFLDFTWRLLEPSIQDGLPDALDLRVFLHFKQDENCPPDERTYLEEVENTYQLCISASPLSIMSFLISSKILIIFETSSTSASPGVKSLIKFSAATFASGLLVVMRVKYC